MQNGHHLSDLQTHYRHYRDDYLAWVADRGYEPSLALPNYRRALVAWYEASIATDAPYEGDPYQFILTLAGVYYGAPPPESETFLGGNPLDHTPRTIRLDEDGQQLLSKFNRTDHCKELLLLADYHQLAPDVLQRVFGGTSTDISKTLATCRGEIGAPDPEAPRWKSVVALAGRLDLISMLEREEIAVRKVVAPASAPDPVPTAVVDVPPSRRSNVKLPSPVILLAGLLFGVLLWLLYDTFATPSPDKLFAEYFTPYPNIFNDAPPTTEAERDLQRILYYYDREDYRTAYDELLPTADYYAAAPLYLGVCALALQDPKRAREWLAKISADSPYRDAAEWYEALATLNLGADAGAKILLEQQATAAGHPFQQRARELLSDL